jgi:SAM-dependent methyltransferase
MTEGTGEQVRPYVLDGRDADLRRLLDIAEVIAETARAAFRKVGIQAGWQAIDCGCGPGGGLTVLAELVGPAGRVVGVDLSQPAIDRAQSAVAALGLGNVEIVTGDLHDFGTSALHGPFDLAFSRCFLMHQADPVRTLRHIAGLLRPGGWLIAQEPLRSPPPRSHPDLDTLAVSWELLHELLERAGVPRGTVEGLAGSARAAGLEVVETGGFFSAMDPEPGFGLHADGLAAARERAVKSGFAAGTIDDVVASLNAAKSGGYEWVSTPFLLDLILRKPVI